jgi:hypothetical protein
MSDLGTFDDYSEHLEAARNANAGSAITVWKDGTWKRWTALDARYAERDETWFLTIPLAEQPPIDIAQGAKAIRQFFNLTLVGPDTGFKPEELAEAVAKAWGLK